MSEFIFGFIAGAIIGFITMALISANRKGE